MAQRSGDDRKRQLEDLRRLISATAPPKGQPVRRPEGPPEARIELAYELTAPSPEAPQPVLHVRKRRVVPGKRPEGWTFAPVSPRTLDRYPDPDDRAILSAIIEATRSTASWHLGADDEPRSRFTLSRAGLLQVLPLLCACRRFQVRLPDALIEVRWREAPWRFRMRARLAPTDAAGPPIWEVEGVLRSDEETVPFAEVDAFLHDTLAIARGTLARVDEGGASSWLGMLRTHRTLRITEPRRAAFLEEIYAAPAPPIDLPEGLALSEISAAPAPRLIVHAPEEGVSGPLFAELGFLYDGVAVAAERRGKVALDPARMILVRRDLEAENKARAWVTELGAEPLPKTLSTPPPTGSHLMIAPARLPEMVRALRAEGFRVEAAAGREYRAGGEFKLKIKSGVDWLDLEGDLDFDGHKVPVSAVLEALRRGQRFVVLGDGTLGVLPEAWLAQHGFVLRLGDAQKGRVRFQRSQAPLLVALTSADRAVRVDRGFAEVREAIAGGASIAPADPPPSFLGELRPYQRLGLGWLAALSRAGVSGLLADDMGLGKTVQVLAHLAERRDRPSLVVAPRSLVWNWKRESARFTPHLRVLDHTGGDRRPPGDHFGDHDLVLTTYGTLRRDASALAGVTFDTVVLDEAQAIKNETSDTARAARGLRAARRLALSGTPVENHLGELWSIIEFLNPGLLGRSSAWRAATAARPTPEALALLAAALKPILLRRTKAEVAPDLPARLEETLQCELRAPERALYDELRGRFRAELLGQVRAEGMRRAGTRVLEALLRLRQAACHPGLVDPARKGERSAKLDALVPELVALAANGQKALVFSQFRSLLDLARPAIEAEGVTCVQLDGKTRDRQAVVKEFQEDPRVSVMLVSLKAGGVGLNLTAAEYVFLLDPWWNPAAEAQAIDRAHRIGQTRAVFAYRMIARDTVEERIAELQQQKRALAESVIRGDGAPLKELTVEDLDRLLS